ncbi:hypothetical protein [Chiayiivirga flava]|uniref:Aspartyl protease n=1 Tax=Chiayiivirga flava TaxID=659595 RepID=A0A7W8FZN4_9GAMM|nr:hypothetical protein [Chiayiivirga flava]MBB5208657.1 hypothetical protein [Chiayiivirga flava]
MILRFFVLFALVTGAPVSAQTPALPVTLPATLESGRFFVAPVTADGRGPLKLFTDTGGGYFLGEAGARALGIEFDEGAAPDPDAPPVLVRWPVWSRNAWIPVSRANGDTVPLQRGALPAAAAHLANGMLGAPWFGGRCWEFDYVAGTLRLLPDGALPRVDAAHRINLGFLKNDAGQHASHFPRITVRVGEEELDLLFDTGASTRVEPAALGVIADGQPAERATSFLIDSIAQRWRKAHPDWRYVEAAETGTGLAMLEVPQMVFAGHTVGPVWFTLRPDANFRTWMAQWMDKPLDGALGGNALAGLRVTVDYASETATFERP